MLQEVFRIEHANFKDYYNLLIYALTKTDSPEDKQMLRCLPPTDIKDFQCHLFCVVHNATYNYYSVRYVRLTNGQLRCALSNYPDSSGKSNNGQGILIYKRYGNLEDTQFDMEKIGRYFLAGR